MIITKAVLENFNACLFRANLGRANLTGVRHDEHRLAEVA